MKVLFFNANGDIDQAAREIFQALSIQNVMQGESSHAIDSIYFDGSALGFRLQIEKNGYDYENDFFYMVTIMPIDPRQKNFDTVEDPFADLVAKIIALVTGYPVAKEVKTNDLKIFNPGE